MRSPPSENAMLTTFICMHAKSHELSRSELIFWPMHEGVEELFLSYMQKKGERKLHGGINREGGE